MTSATAGRGDGIAVVVVNWNTRDDLTACLESLCRCAIPVDTVVVDNASQDGSAALVRARFPWARLLESGANVGFGAACNRGIAATRAPFVAVLNPDVTLAPDTLPSLVELLERSPRVGIAAPRLVSPAGELLRSCSPFPTVVGELARLTGLDRLGWRRGYPLARWALEPPRRVDTVEGACVLLRRTAVEEVGAFDERFFMYSEEVDLCRRLADAGWEVIWAPSAVARHQGGASSRQVGDRMFLELHRGKVLYFRKHAGPGAVRAYKMVLGAAALARVVLAPPLAAFSRSDGGARLRTLGSRYRRLLGVLAGL